MGWTFRRSKKFGPFRLTVGKKGVGVSVGVKGARIGVGADGRTRASMSIPGTGLSYRETLSRPHAAAPPPDFSTTPRRALRPWPVVGLTLFGGCLCISILSHKSGTTSQVALPPPVDVDGASVVSDACEKLKGSGFVARCVQPQTGLQVILDIALSDFRNDLTRITFDRAAVVEVEGGSRAEVERDYPNIKVASPRTRLSIEVIHGLDGGADEWNKCLTNQGKAGGVADGKRKAAVAACAKKYPLRYAWFHAFYDEVKQIVDGVASSVTCSTGYLCGTGCTPHGATCCIETGHTDQTCPGGGLCTGDGKCIGGASLPGNLSAGGFSGCTCGDGTIGCCGRGCCSHHGGIR